MRQLESSLEEGGVWPGPLTLREGEEANFLVASNPSMLRRLEALGLHANELPDMKPIETVLARLEIQADRADPQCRLESWAAAVSQMS